MRLRTVFGGVVENDTPPPSYTPGRMRITIDPILGNDDAPFTLALDSDPTDAGRPAQLTYVATLQTIQGAVNRLPMAWRHPIFIDLPAGTFTPPISLITFGPDLTITNHLIASDQRFIDAGLFTYDATPGLYWNGAKTITLADTVADIFSSTTIGNAALAMTTDIHRGAVVEILPGGTGAGQWRRVARNGGDRVHIADSWGTLPDITSHFRVWRPASVLDCSVTVGNVIAGFASPGVVFSPEIEIKGPTSWGLFLGNGAAALGCTITGDSIGYHRLIQAGPDSVVYCQWTDLWRDPSSLANVGFAATDGEMLHYDAYNVVNGFRTNVLDRARYTLQDTCTFAAKIDADGSTGGSRAGYAFMTIDGASKVLVTPAQHAAASIKRHSTGVEVMDRSKFDGQGLNISDHGAQGIIVRDGSVADLRGTTSTAPNITYGVDVASGGKVHVNRTTTTITGGTADCRLGNAASGVDHAWADISAGDALADPKELCNIMDHA